MEIAGMSIIEVAPWESHRIPSTLRKSKGGQEGNQERPSDSGQHAEKATQSYDPLHGSQQRPVMEGGRSKFGFGMFWNVLELYAILKF